MSAELCVLVVDDDEAMLDACRQALGRPGCAVRLARAADEAVASLRAEPADVVVLDLRLPGESGMDLLERLRRRWPDTAVIMVTGYATIPAAVEAIRRGAFDFVPKPFTPAVLRSVVARALRAAGSAAEHPAGRVGLGDMVGQSDAIRRVKVLVARVAASESTVLITGESGTGKELVAKALHAGSPRRDGPFVAVDCASLVESLVGGELFGHVRGAFTDAHADRKGRFEVAGGGTLFFDEIGAVRPETQGKLLRALQERVIHRVGSSEPTPVDVRVVAATNVDLADAVRAGRFREDLYYRLSVIPIFLPPLRRRREDVLPLAEHFLRRWSAEEDGRPAPELTADACDILLSYDWPGNVRELENTIERAVVLAERSRIDADDLVLCGVGVGEKFGPSPAEASALTLHDVERQHIGRVLARYGGNRSRAARSLGIDRKTLQRKIAKYEL